MNRAERRRIMKKFPEYKKALKESAGKAVNDLETMLKKGWLDDETLNEGNKDYGKFAAEDEIYND